MSYVTVGVRFDPAGQSHPWTRTACT